MPDLHVPNLDDDTLAALKAQAEAHGRSLSEEARAILTQHVERQAGIRTGEERADFLRQIKQAVHEVEPDADLWLFGSYARGDARPESDWDLLVLLDGPVDRDRKQTLRHCLFELELDSGEAISARIYSRDEWQSEPRQSSSFARNVCKHAIAL
jgi:predicted nucleotidyltransferase